MPLVTNVAFDQTKLPGNSSIHVLPAVMSRDCSVRSATFGTVVVFPRSVATAAGWWSPGSGAPIQQRRSRTFFHLRKGGRDERRKTPQGYAAGLPRRRSLARRLGQERDRHRRG